MTIKTKIYLMLFLPVSLFAMEKEKERFCERPNENIDCLISNWDALSERAKIRQDVLFATVGEKLKECKSKVFTIKYLSFASKIIGSASFMEYYCEEVEKVLAQQPRCILDAAVELNEKDRSAFLSLVGQPIFTEPNALIKKISPFENDKKIGELSSDLIKRLKKFEEKR